MNSPATGANARSFILFLLLLLTIEVRSAARSKYTVKRFDFRVQYQNVTRLCQTKSLPTINGQFPGPTIAVNEGDHVEVKVHNDIDYNMTIHWHGIRQLGSGWSDGPAYITQCPIQKGQSYTYKFKVEGQMGTLFWHAHISWQRSSIHGAFIIYPRKGVPYPFPKPDAEAQILFGEWWKGDVEAIEAQANKYGGGPNVSDAYTINGQPGLLFPCSAKVASCYYALESRKLADPWNGLQDLWRPARTNHRAVQHLIRNGRAVALNAAQPYDTFVQHVHHGKRYLLRIINAALNDQLFFAIANHSMTVVEIDATYTKPYRTDYILLAPGQTMSVIMAADQSRGKYMMAARPYVTSDVPFDNSTTTAILEYSGISSRTSSGKFQIMSNLPDMKDTASATKFSVGLKSLNSRQYPSVVPKKIDTRLLFTVGLNLQDCPPGETCKGYFGGRFSASVNNQSFILPNTALLQAAYSNISGVFSRDFPTRPPWEFNYTTSNPSINMNPQFSTRVNCIPYNANVELILQDTTIMGSENHPIHIHGYNFFVVGRGFGNYNPRTDPFSFNLVDPPMRNTIGVPTGGWAALRFKADNPGVWFMHCHLEVHTTWGLAMAFLVEKEGGLRQSLGPPPHDLPSC